VLVVSVRLMSHGAELAQPSFAVMIVDLDTEEGRST